MTKKNIANFSFNGNTLDLEFTILKKLFKFYDTHDIEVSEIYEKDVEFESSRRVYSDEGDSPTIDSSNNGGIIVVHNLHP